LSGWLDRARGYNYLKDVGRIGWPVERISYMPMILVELLVRLGVAVIADGTVKPRWYRAWRLLA
jgi:hypothetical protein